MITIYKNSDSGLVQLSEPVNGCWIHLQDPDAKEILSLAELGIPTDFITPALDSDERARTEREDNGVVLIVLRVPVSLGKLEDVPYNTVALGIILNEKYMVTVTKGASSLLEEFANGKMKGFSTGKRNRFVLRILHNAANSYLVALRDINKKVDGLEEQLQHSLRNREVLELLKYEKSLIYFSAAIKANELVLERLQRSQLFKLYPEDEDLLDAAIIENQQALEMVNVATSILNSMAGAFSSMISNNLNVVMKFLTSVTIVLSLPALLVNFTGMNAALAFKADPVAMLVVCVLFLLTAGIIVWFFMRKDWY